MVLFEPRPGRRYAGRRGASLVECLVVISIASVMLAVAVGMVGTVLRVERGGRRHLLETGGLARLSEQFRRDVALAERIVPAGAAGSPAEILRLAQPEARLVEYRSQGGRIVRSQRLADLPAGRHGKLLGRETFVLPAPGKARFEVHPIGRAELVALALEQPGLPKSGASSGSWRIEAVLGRDHRFDDNNSPPERSGDP